MGQHDVSEHLEGEDRRRFMKRLIEDVHALDKMVRDNLFETGVHRIGAEQEMFLADDGGRPLCAALEVLETIDDPHFTTELALFNLELNLDPLDFEGSCLRRMEEALDRHLQQAEEAARRHDAHIVLTGILPSLRKSDMGLDNMTPLPRYAALNRSTVSTAENSPSCTRCACTRGPSGGGIGPATGSVTGRHTCVSRIASCPRGRPLSMRWRTPRCGSV